MFSLEDQQRWILALVYHLNETTNTPVVYAGHTADDLGLRIDVFAMRPALNPYAEILVGWHDMLMDAERMGLSDLRNER